MGFLAPWFLAGIAAIGLPVYLHLLRRHTNTPRPFSSLMFFERRTQSSIKHRRLRYLLLFSVRALLLLLLALAFANPFINRAAANMTSDRLMLVVLDNSFSMRAGSRMADARSEALSVLSSRSGDEKAQVMALGSQLHVLTEPTVDSGALRAAVESVKPGDSRGNFAELARAVRSLSDSVHTPIELHLISDMQKTAMPASFSELGMPANVSLVLHPLVKSAVPNWTVESVNAPGQVFDTKKARTQIVVAGFDTPAATRTVSLVVGGKTIATKMVEVPANGRATVEFESLEVPYGFTRCEVRIDSADSFPADDVSIFAVERADPRRALFVHEGNDTKSLVYFRAALTSAAESAFVLEAVTPEQLSNVPYSKYAFVVLDDLLSLPASAESDLAKYVQSGGSILIAAGAATSHSSHIPVLGNKIMDARYYSRTGDRFLNVGDADATHPSIEKADRWAGVKFYFATVVDPGDDRIAARLTDQTPILLEKKIGEGTVLLFASGFDNLTNDFPLHSAFVPFVDQTSRYLSGTERRSGSRVVDSFLDLRNSKEQAVSVEVIDPEGQRPLSLKETSTAQSYQLIEAGFYELQLADGRHDLIGVNADRRESDLAVIPDNTLSLWKGSPGGVTQQTSGGGVAAQEQTKPYSLWWYVMLLLFAAVVAESVLADQYLGTQQEEP